MINAGQPAPATGVRSLNPKYDPLWLGRHYHLEAKSLFRRCREAGLTATRAHAVACLATFKHCYARRKTIAGVVLCSVRTVQRGHTQAKELGLITSWRNRKGQIPPQGKEPLSFRWADRQVVGWGQAGAKVKQAVEEARAKWLRDHSANFGPDAPKVRGNGSTMDPVLATQPRKRRELSTARRLTSAEIDAELAELARAREHPPPE